MKPLVDPIWDALVDLVLPMGPIREQSSRYGDKPAVVLDSGEIAHREAAGVIDLRITRQAWIRVRSDWAGDPSVTARSGRRDWVELTIGSVDDLARLKPLIAAAVEANR